MGFDVNDQLLIRYPASVRENTENRSTMQLHQLDFKTAYVHLEGK
jgi:hypothetical protein